MSLQKLRKTKHLLFTTETEGEWFITDFMSQLIYNALTLCKQATKFFEI